MSFGRVKRSLDESLELLSKAKVRKFNETVEIAVKLNLNTKKPENNFKDLCVLPNPLPKKTRILVIDEDMSSKEAEELGVDHFGGKEVIDRIKDGWVDFDVLITTSKMMPMMSKLGKVLGPRNLMPSPKLGTVTNDVAKAVESFKKGKVSVKNDSFGNVHFVIGKRDFEKEKLIENFNFAIEFIKSKKPKNHKGRYIEKVFLSSTMGPSYAIELPGLI